MNLTTVEGPGINTPEYETERRSGADRLTLVRNLAECTFHGLRRLQAYSMAGMDKRRAFSSDLARGKLIDSCPFPFEVALLRALHMGLLRWRGNQETASAQATAYMDTVRFGVTAPHLPAVVEYPPEVFFRAFQGAEVHRDVPFLEDSSDEARSIDWMDFRTYSFPPLEKDFLWDLFLMDRSPWADPNPTIDAGHALLPESQPHRSLPVMVARQRNRDRVNGRGFIGMIHPGASLHLHMVTGSAEAISDLLPALIGAHTVPLPEPAQPVCELRDDDCWLVASYNPPPPMADDRYQVVPLMLPTEGIS